MQGESEAMDEVEDSSSTVNEPEFEDEDGYIDGEDDNETEDEFDIAEEDIEVVVSSIPAAVESGV